MKIPTIIPEKGFYYHYKHDANGPINNYAYEMLGVGCHTEDDCRPVDANMVVYRPLYEDAMVYKSGRFFDLRPIDMWMGDVHKDGNTFPRFKKIIDTKTIAALDVIKQRLYETS